MQAMLAPMQTDEQLTFGEYGQLLRLKKSAMAAAKRHGSQAAAVATRPR